MVKSMGDVGRQIKSTTSLEQLEEATAEDLLSDVVSDKQQRPGLTKSHSAITFNELEKLTEQDKPNDLSSIQVFILSDVPARVAGSIGSARPATLAMT